MLRKARELLYAVALEESYDKRELLEHYLNQVYLGARTYGVAAAARQYFGIEVGEITAEQAALLAGLIQSPGRLDPRTNPEAAERRRNAVLSLAASEGVVDPAEAETLRAAPMELAPPPPLTVQEPLIAEAVRRQLLTEPALGETREEREELLATGGLRIETTIDPRLQEGATAALFGALGRWEGLGTGLAAVDPHSGRIVAAASLSPEGTKSFDLATQARRQPGSTYKTVAAIAAIEAGMDPDERLVGDGPTEIEYAPGRHWTVDNYSGSNHGRIPLGEALASSVNTAFAQVAVAVGTDRIVDVTERLGIDAEPALGPADERGPSLALGALHHGVSPLEMASAYGVFATNGLRVEPYIVERVVDRDGRELLRRKAEPEPAVDPAVIGVVRDMLTDAVRSGTGRAADLPGWDIAGKTGTSQQHADAWFVGAVPTLSVATWIGHPNASQPVQGLTGGSAAAPIWHDFMQIALDGADPVPFPEPPWPLEIDEDPPELPETRRPRNGD
jgi:penicillin-binding protein 1A